MQISFIQVHTFYEAVGMMISAELEMHKQEVLLEKLFLLPNQVWDSIISQATLVCVSSYC